VELEWELKRNKKEDEGKGTKEGRTAALLF
jgi:hypothetical protein